MKNLRFWIAGVVLALAICAAWQCRHKNSPERIPALDTVDNGGMDTTAWIDQHSEIPHVDTMNVRMAIIGLYIDIEAARIRDKQDEVDYWRARNRRDTAKANKLVNIYRADVAWQNHLMDSLNWLNASIGKPEIKR